MTRYIRGLRGSAYDDVTVRQLLTMTSGVRWNEDYNDANSDIARFYEDPVTPGLDATVSCMRRRPREAPPGATWHYSTGETHLLGVLVAAATGQSLADYLAATIWKPYGMERRASWSTDRTGHELAGCCLQASLRDFARFGQCVLDDGMVGGRRVGPAGWHAAATSTQMATPSHRPGASRRRRPQLRMARGDESGAIRCTTAHAGKSGWSARCGICTATLSEPSHADRLLRRNLTVRSSQA